MLALNPSISFFHYQFDEFDSSYRFKTWLTKRTVRVRQYRDKKSTRQVTDNCGRVTLRLYIKPNNGAGRIPESTRSVQIFGIWWVAVLESKLIVQHQRKLAPYRYGSRPAKYHRIDYKITGSLRNYEAILPLELSSILSFDYYRRKLLYYA